MIRRVHIVVALLIFCLSAGLTALGAQRRGASKGAVQSASGKTVVQKKKARKARARVSKKVKAARVRRAKARRGRRARVRRLVWNPLFRGSHEMLVRQNLQIDELALPRIADDDELDTRIAAGELVPMEDSQYLTIASNLKDNRRYCKPWTRDFLEDLSEDFYTEFHRPLVITSLVRTAEQQKKLRRRNRNAAPEDGETVSTHLTGMTFDLLKRGLTRKQHQWLEQYFLPLKELGLVEPIEERRQPVFHVTVFTGYTDWADAQDGESDEVPDAPAGIISGSQSISDMRGILDPGTPIVAPNFKAPAEASRAVAAN